jgi:mannan endo-1,4-beta-mannosidase
VHAGPNIDVGSIHEYDYDYNGTKTIVSSHLAPTLAAMKSIGKPLLVAEVGVKGNDGTGCTDRTARRDVFKAKFDAYFAQGAVGVLAWNWTPTKRDACAYETLYPGDPTMDLIRTY